MLLVAGVARYQSRSHRSLTGAVTTASGAVTVALCHSLTLSRTTLAVFTDNSGNLRIHNVTISLYSVAFQVITL